MAQHSGRTHQTEVNYVTESWKQDNEANYVIGNLPQVDALDHRNGDNGKTSWSIPDLDTAMAKDDEEYDWLPGGAHQAANTHGATDVELEIRHREAKPERRNVKKEPAPYKFADMQNGLGPAIHSRQYGSREKALVAFVKSGTYGATVAFSGARALSFNDDDQDPVADIEAILEPLRLYEGLGLSLECLMGQRFVHVGRKHHKYTQEAAASGTNMLEVPNFVRAFMGKHSIKRVHTFGSVHDTVKRGQASAPGFVGRRLLAFVIVDRRKAKWELHNGSDTGPDGGLVCGVGRPAEIVVDSSRIKADEVEWFFGRQSYGFCNPRGANFGVVFDEATISA